MAFGIQKMVDNLVNIELNKWYLEEEFYADSSKNFELPYNKNFVELHKDHPFLQIPLVIGYINSAKNNMTELIISIDKRKDMYRSGTYRIYEWAGTGSNPLRWRFDCIFALHSFRIKGEFSLEMLEEREKKRQMSKKFGI